MSVEKLMSKDVSKAKIDQLLEKDKINVKEKVREKEFDKVNETEKEKANEIVLTVKDKERLKKEEDKFHKRSKTLVLVSTHVNNTIESESFQEKIKTAFEDPTKYFDFNDNKLIIGKTPSGPKYVNNQILPYTIVGSKERYNNINRLTNLNIRNSNVTGQRKTAVLTRTASKKSTINEEKIQSIQYIDDINLSKIFEDHKTTEAKSNVNHFFNKR